MKNLLNDFGYCNWSDFTQSLLRIDNSVAITTSASAMTIIVAFMEKYMNLKFESLICLFLLLCVELVTGIVASIKEHKKITSRRLQRFGLKVFIYGVILATFSIFMRQYDNSFVMKEVYSGIHSFVVLYIIGVYSISILENTSAILGGTREFDSIIKLIRKKIKTK
jgi:hypothetical protein